MTALAQELDQRLNSDYQYLMQRLSPEMREQLRRSERAWIKFRDLDHTALRSSRETLGLSKSESDAFDIRGVANRINEFLVFAKGGASPADSSEIERADADLNSVYRKCIASIGARHAAKLREAQRAWITFRDAHRGLGLDLWLSIIQHRTDQLREFYIEYPTANARENELNDHWIVYLKEIQADKSYPNWTAPPYDLYLSNRTR